MYSPIPNIREKITRLREDLSLKFKRENLGELIDNRIRFYRLIAQTGGQAVFLKTPLSKDPASLAEFLNEINFHLALERDPAHPLNRYVPKIIAYSLKPSLPFLLRVAARGNHRKSEDEFSRREILEITRALKSIRSSPAAIFSFTPGFKLFSAERFSKTAQGSKNLVGKRLDARLKTFVRRAKTEFLKFKPVLSHGDFSEANTIFEPGGGVKIIDWSKVNLRNPLYDQTEFWIKRRRRKLEQNLLFKEAKKDFPPNDFNFLFSAALIEIVLRDLKLFQHLLKKYRRQKRAGRLDRVQAEREEYLSILKQHI